MQVALQGQGYATRGEFELSAGQMASLERQPSADPPIDPSGSWGPNAAVELLARDDWSWDGLA